MWLFCVLSGFIACLLLPFIFFLSTEGWICVLHFFVVILFAVSYCVILQMGFDYLGPLAFPSGPA